MHYQPATSRQLAIQLMRPPGAAVRVLGRHGRACASTGDQTTSPRRASLAARFAPPARMDSGAAPQGLGASCGLRATARRENTEKLAKALLERETLTREEVLSLLEGDDGTTGSQHGEITRQSL